MPAISDCHLLALWLLLLLVLQRFSCADPRFCLCTALPCCCCCCADGDVLSQCFTGQQLSADQDYLGLEHEDKGPRRPTSSTTRYTYERAIKIHN